MATFGDKLKQKYRQGNIIIRLIFINTAIFLILRLLFAILSLTGLDGKWVLDWLQMPAGLVPFLEKPWTAFTYMFVHFDLMHILMNMFFLYFFGGIFLRWFSERQLLVQYIFGGLCGALFFVLGYSLMPSLEMVENPAPLIGASASVIGLCVAMAVYRPDEQIPLFMLGSLRLKYIAIIIIVLDLLSFGQNNAGVGLAHLGGALYGLSFGLFIRRGKDLTAWISPLIYEVKSLFKPQPKTKLKYKRSKREKVYKTSDVDQQYRDSKKMEADQIDAILDKIKQSGYDSLSKEEKSRLFDSSNRI